MVEADQQAEIPQWAEQKLKAHPNSWVLFIDGSSTTNGLGVGIVFKTSEGALIEQTVWLWFKASNNEADYEALIVGMKKARKLGVQDLVIHCDSQLMANLLTGEYVARNERIGAYMRLT